MNQTSFAEAFCDFDEAFRKREGETENRMEKKHKENKFASKEMNETEDDFP